MTLERQKKFLFISSKFQTPADKVIKVSAGTEGAQYLGRRRGEGECWVESYLLFTKFLPFYLALSITGLGGFMPVITKLFEEFLSGPALPLLRAIHPLVFLKCATALPKSAFRICIFRSTALQSAFYAEQIVHLLYATHITPHANPILRCV